MAFQFTNHKSSHQKRPTMKTFVPRRDSSTSISGWVKDEDIEELAIAILVERGYKIKPLTEFKQ